MLSSGSLVDWIIRNRQQMLVPNFDQHKHKLGYYREGEEAGIKAFMGCPVPTGGALCVDSKRQYSFTDRDYKLLQLFAASRPARAVRKWPGTAPAISPSWP